MGSAGGLQLTLLGGFRLRVDGVELRLPVASERVLAFLALHGEDPTRSQVSGNLWPETTEEKAAANLRSALWRIRQLAPAAVESHGHHVVLGGDVDVDVHELVDLAHTLLAVDGADDLFDVDIDAQHFARELLPGFWDSWLVFERERVRQLALSALERMAEVLLVAERTRHAVLVALAAVEADPLRETSNLLLVRAHLACGNRSEAIRQVDRYRDRLHRELAIEPGASFSRMLAHTG